MSKKIKHGANSDKVQREDAKADELIARAAIAKKRYYAKREPEYRALTLERISRCSAIFGALLMAGFGAWSAVGVHAGVTKNSGGQNATAADSFAGWVLEPVILACIAGIVLVRAALALAGARLNPGVWFIELGLLGLSLAANINALPANPTLANYVMRLTGPIGCLLVSLVMVAIDRAVRAANIEITTAVSADRPSEWAGVRERFGRTVSTVAGRFVDSLANKAQGLPVDSVTTPATATVTTGHAPVTTGVDTAVTTPATVGMDSVTTPVTTGMTTRVDSGHDQAVTPVVTAATSVDTPVTTPVDSSVTTPRTPVMDTSKAGHDHPVTPVTPAVDDDVDSTEQTVVMPTIAGLVTVDAAVTIVRKIVDDEGVDAVTKLSQRQLADRVGCSKGTAVKARDRVLEELQDAVDDSEGDEPIEKEA